MLSFDNFTPALVSGSFTSGSASGPAPTRSQRHTGPTTWAIARSPTTAVRRLRHARAVVARAVRAIRGTVIIGIIQRIVSTTTSVSTTIRAMRPHRLQLRTVGMNGLTPQTTSWSAPPVAGDVPSYGELVLIVFRGNSRAHSSTHTCSRHG